MSPLLTFKQTSSFFFQEFPNNLAFNFKELDPNQSATVMNVAMLFQSLTSGSSPCVVGCTPLAIAHRHFEENSLFFQKHNPSNSEYAVFSL